MDTATILEKAADVIDKRGHCRFEFEYHGRMCALGAICFVMHGETNADAYKQTVLPVAQAFHRLVGKPLSWFNDQSRTQDEVTSKMRSVAAIIRAQSALEPAPELVTA